MRRPRSVRARKAQSAAVRARATPNVTSRPTSTKRGPIHRVAPVSVERTRWGSGPKATRAAFSSASATPSIRRICISCGASTMRCTSPRWMAQPRANSAAAQRGKPRYGSTPSRVARTQARYIPHTIMSPWAKLTTRMTPKISVRPTAMRLYTPPKSSPLSRLCPTRVGSTSGSPDQRFGRGNTNFWSATSFGHTATGFWPSTWIMVVTALGLSPAH